MRRCLGNQMDLTEKIDKLIYDKLKIKPTLEIYKYLFSRDMELFGKFYFPEKINRPNSDFHRWLYNNLLYILQRERTDVGHKLAVAAPRGYAKSSLISFILPLWSICFDKRNFIVLISETESQAEDFLTDIQNELVSNQLLKEHFPHAMGKSPKRWRQTDIVTNNDIRVLAIGAGGKLRGRAYGRIRPDLVVLDDIESRESVESEVVRIRLRNQWFRKEVLNCGRTDGTTDFIAVGTILHEDSLLNNILSDPLWKSKRFYAVIKWASRADLWDTWKTIFVIDGEEKAREFYLANEAEMLVGSEVLWPEVETYYQLMCMTLTPESESAFWSEKQNSPIDLSRVKIKQEDLNFFFEKDLEGKDLSFVGAFDPAEGKSASAYDYPAIVSIASDEDGNAYVYDIDITKEDFTVRIDTILNYHEMRRFRIFAVEMMKYEKMMKEYIAMKCRERGLPLYIEPVKNVSDKDLRVASLTPYILEGRLKFRHPSEWNSHYKEGIRQLLFYGAGAQHDDVPDAMEMAFNILRKGLFKRKALVNKRTIVVHG